MTVREALNRTYNLVGTAIVAISGFAFFPQTFSEDEFTHKLDEGGLFLLAVGALIWYFVGHNKVSRTVVPILFMAASLVVKLVPSSSWRQATSRTWAMSMARCCCLYSR